MDPENEKIQLDDITFDDVIGGEGVETITPEAPVQEVVNEEVLGMNDDSTVAGLSERSQERIDRFMLDLERS